MYASDPEVRPHFLFFIAFLVTSIFLFALATCPAKIAGNTSHVHNEYDPGGPMIDQRPLLIAVWILIAAPLLLWGLRIVYVGRFSDSQLLLETPVRSGQPLRGTIQTNVTTPPQRVRIGAAICLDGSKAPAYRAHTYVSSAEMLRGGDGNVVIPFALDLPQVSAGPGRAKDVQLVARAGWIAGFVARFDFPMLD